MALKAVVSSITDVPENLRSLYVQKDGKYVLDLEGDPLGYVPAATAEENARKLAEFRDNNRALNAAKTELETKLKSLEGIDPAEHAALKAKIAELEGKQKGMKGDDDIKKLLEAAVTPLQQRLDALAAADAAKAKALADKELESTLTQAGIKAGVDDKALPDYIRRGKDVFSLVDGKIVAKNGDTPLFSKARPAEPLTVDEWVTSLPAEAPHLFKPSKGGGANPGPGGSGAGAPRVIAAEGRLTGADIEALAKGEAVRGSAA